MKIVRMMWKLSVIILIIGCYGSVRAEEGGARNYYVGPGTPKEGKIRIGNISIIPGFAVQEEYDDNIYLKNGDNNTTQRKESDWITHLNPSILAKYSMMERGAISLGYVGDFALYNSNSGNNWASNRIAFKGDYKAPVGFIVGINNDYVNADDPYADLNSYRLGQKTKRWYDDLQTKIGYEFLDRFRVMGFYNFYKQEYAEDRDSNQDYYDNEVGIGAEMRVMPMTWAFLRYYTGVRDFTSHSSSVPNFSESNDADYKWNRVNTGLTWDATAKIKGELNLGYQWLTADNTVDPYGNRYEDRNTWIASTRVNYLATPKTRLGGELFRATRFSGADLSQFYDETGIGVNLNQDIMTRGVLRIGAGYAIHDYNQPYSNKREDNNFKTLVGFDYYITDWLMAGVEYRYWNRDSNYHDFDFNDNRFMMTLGVTY
jgi:hypothetical protein